MKITVFTPTYNRAYVIENLYRSLQRQSISDFEWIVIDDGSNDNTEELFAAWITEKNTFPIRYYKQSNSGKCRAINRALDLAEGELFFTVDSDDYLTDDALEKVAGWAEELPANGKYCGFAGNLGTSPSVTPNSPIRGDFFDGTALDRYGTIDGERAMIFFTEVHRHYKYPVFSGENFMTEAVTWNRMAHDGYMMRFYNDIIWVYEYKDDGLTKAGSSVFLKNPHGYGLWIREKMCFQGISFWEKLKVYYTFVCDLSGQYDNKLIAECIQVPVFFVSIVNIVRKF